MLFFFAYEDTSMDLFFDGMDAPYIVHIFNP